MTQSGNQKSIAGGNQRGSNTRAAPNFPYALTRRMHNKLLAAARCIRATLSGKIDDLQFASLRVHI
jgi:hypothetical protein